MIEMEFGDLVECLFDNPFGGLRKGERYTVLWSDGSDIMVWKSTGYLYNADNFKVINICKLEK